MSKLITAAHFLPVEPHLVLVDVGRKVGLLIPTLAPDRLVYGVVVSIADG